MRAGSRTAAAIAIMLIAAGGAHGDSLGSGPASRPAGAWRLAQQAEPSTAAGAARDSAGATSAREPAADGTRRAGRHSAGQLAVRHPGRGARRSGSLGNCRQERPQQRG